MEIQNEAFWDALDRLVTDSEVIIDRPKGSTHPRYPTFVYPADYGYLKNTASMDGGGIDVWLGTDSARRLDAIICTVDLVKRDSEIKLLIGCTADEKAIIHQICNETAFMKGIMIHRSIREQKGAFRPVTKRSHITILRELLSDLSIANISHILDAGSGKTSLSTIISCFPKASVDAIVYPGDERKLKTVRDMQSDKVNVVERDICNTPVPAHYDLVVAHLLLGEASKFGNTFQNLLQNLLSIQSRYYIIIDYLEDPAVDADTIRTYCESVDLKVRKYVCAENSEPQVWDDFIGTHNFGFLIESECIHDYAHYNHRDQLAE